jgi:hypothetical protein
VRSILTEHRLDKLAQVVMVAFKLQTSCANAETSKKIYTLFNLVLYWRRKGYTDLFDINRLSRCSGVKNSKNRLCGAVATAARASGDKDED